MGGSDGGIEGGEQKGGAKDRRNEGWKDVGDLRGGVRTDNRKEPSHVRNEGDWFTSLTFKHFLG